MSIRDMIYTYCCIQGCKIVTLTRLYAEHRAETTWIRVSGIQSLYGNTVFCKLF